MYSVYIYENLINGKIYIGQTCNLKDRDRTHCDGRNKKIMPIDAAIFKYGRDNFSFNIITEVDTKEQADYAEIDWIVRARNLLGKRSVYNIRAGGAQGRHSEKTKKKMSIAGKLRCTNGFIPPNPNKKGEPRQDASTVGPKISLSLTGKKASPETKLKQSTAHRKLTDQQVQSIKFDPRMGQVIAKEYGVGSSTIYRIKSGQGLYLQGVS